MSSSDYKPEPLDISQVSLPPSIEALVERLARNTHEVWAEQRITQGWTLGPRRDDEKREHPCLIPYEELSEQEKDYDRSSVRAPIQAILAMGYQLVPPEADPASSTSSESDPLLRLISASGKGAAIPSEELRRLWEHRDARCWALYPEYFTQLAEFLQRSGVPFLAFDVAAEGLKFSSSLRLKQIQALALAQTGALLSAQRILEELAAAGHDDSETLGILARIHKDLSRIVPDESERKGHLATAYNHYLTAFRKHHDYYPGINAASVCVFRDDLDEARRLASEVRELCLREIESGTTNYWILATLGEACLILGDLDDASDYYQRGFAIAPNEFASVSSTRRQAQRLLRALNIEFPDFEKTFPIPTVVVFTGHRPDLPDRKDPRFPATEIERVKQALRDQLDTWDASIGYASAASGGDILFLEAILERGGSIHVILPVGVDLFKETSVLDGADPSWGDRFDQVLSQATTVTCLSDEIQVGDSAVYAYANQILLGLAKLNGRELASPVRALALWNGGASEGPGGTSDCVRTWRKTGSAVEVISPIAGLAPPPPGPPRAKPTRDPSRLHQEIKAALFADIVGYSKLAESEIPAYLEHFMGKVGELCNQSPHAPEVRNTWGDAFYFVFDSVHDAGLFALSLREIVADTDWRALGFSRSLRIRIALHAGPVFPCQDPVTGQDTYTGSHVSRTARIEPIAEENQIFASQSFAALAASNDVAGLKFEYAGERPLAKNYGTDRLFILHPA